jgi:hypothetical protein
MKLTTLSVNLLLSLDFVGNAVRKLCSYERIDENAAKKARNNSGMIVVKFLLLFNVTTNSLSINK